MNLKTWNGRQRQIKVKLPVVQNIVLVNSAKAKDDPRIVDVERHMTAWR